MPLYGDRLFNSAFDAAASGEEFRVALLLWWRAFQSVPAGSLADDDFELAKAAGFGRDLEKWFAVKHAALHNFVRCRDGRLYHTVVCEVAKAAWKRRTTALKRKKKFVAGLKAQRTRSERVPDAFGTRLEESTGHEMTGEGDEGTEVSEVSKQGRNERRVPPL
jgi:hypothetical protein